VSRERKAPRAVNISLDRASPISTGTSTDAVAGTPPPRSGDKLRP
jgi:hypothetical protein